MRRLLGAFAVLVALWFTALLVLDHLVGPRQARAVADRLSESLQASSTIGSADLALVRGGLAIEQLAVRRDDVIGHLAIDVRELNCSLAPLGWALVDGSCGELAVHGMRFEVSTAALFHLPKPNRAPVTARRVVIDDAELAFAPSAFLPDLGRIAISIEHAEAGRTVFRSPLSWLLALDTLRAKISLPAGIALHLTYAHGKLAAAGALFGSTPVEVPFTLPIASAAHDAGEEMQLLVQAGKDVAERLVEKRAQDWLQSKLR